MFSVNWLFLPSFVIKKYTTYSFFYHITVCPIHFWIHRNVDSFSFRERSKQHPKERPKERTQGIHFTLIIRLFFDSLKKTLSWWFKIEHLKEWPQDFKQHPKERLEEKNKKQLISYSIRCWQHFLVDSKLYVLRNTLRNSLWNTFKEHLKEQLKERLKK